MGTPTLSSFGKIAQMVELLVEAQGATGSIPVLTTNGVLTKPVTFCVWVRI